MTSAKTRKPKTEAAMIYAREVDYAVGMLESILMAVRDVDRVDAERCHYGHVAQILHLNQQLREIEDRLYKKGEYHPSNVAALPPIR
jgi:hypothetical protein